MLDWLRELNRCSSKVKVAVVAFKRVTFIFNNFPLSDFNSGSVIKFETLDQNPPKFSNIFQPSDSSCNLEVDSTLR